MESDKSSTNKKRTHKRLTDKFCSSARPREKPWKLYDKYSGGLYLLVSPAGSKLWRFKFRYQGKLTEMSLGRYPGVSLADARKRALEMRQLLDKGQNPVAVRKAERTPKITGTTFESVALDWIERNRAKWSERHTQKVFRRLEIHVFPWLGDRGVDDIKTADLLSVLRRVEGRGIELAHCVQQYSSAVFRYAIACGVAETDPATVLRGALKPVVVRHYAAITEPRAFGELLRAIDGYQGSFIVKCALRLVPYVFIRPGELRGMRWEEIDFGGALWRIDAARMKMRREHIVPLARQVVGILREIQPLTGNARLVFPSERSNERAMSENSLNAALRRLGYTKNEMTSHGFRSTASSLLNEMNIGSPDAIELQLAHRPQGVRAVYHRSEHLKERRAMMQRWADYIDQLRGNNEQTHT